jgi:hypothetical protein
MHVSVWCTSSILVVLSYPPPPEMTRYLLHWRLGGPQGQSGRVRKISPPPGSDPRTAQARSETLYRPCYPGSHTRRVRNNNINVSAQRMNSVMLGNVG